MENIIRFSVSLPQELLDRLDEKIKESNYASRSEFTRDLIRQKIVQDEWENSSNELIGVFSVVYDHHTSDVVLKKMKLEHHANVKILSTMHFHIDHKNCLEISVLKGKSNFIKSFASQIAGIRGIKFSELSKVGVPES